MSNQRFCSAIQDLIDDSEKIMNYPIVGAIKKRIKCEYIKLRKYYKYVSIDFINGEVVLQLFSNNDNHYKIVISENYPFVPPKFVVINGIPHNKFLKINCPRLVNILKSISKIECLCCTSYLCISNWIPKLGVEDLVIQFEEFKTIKNYIYTKILVDQIKKKYAINDLDIISWLFNIDINTNQIRLL